MLIYVCCLSVVLCHRQIFVFVLLITCLFVIVMTDHYLYLAFYFLSYQFCLQSYNFFLNYANKSLFFPTSPQKISTFLRANKLRTRANQQLIYTAKIARLSHPRLYYI